jgi:hypothetical protein
MASHWQLILLVSMIGCVGGCGDANSTTRQAALDVRFNEVKEELAASKAAILDERDRRAALELRFSGFAQELTQSKVAVQQTGVLRAEWQTGYSELTQELAASRREIDILKGLLHAFQATKGTSMTEMQMATDGFQRDIARLQDEIEGLRREHTMVDILLERVPATRLKLKADLRFGGTLDDVLAQMAVRAGIPMRVLAGDLKEEMIPTNRRLELDYKNMTYEQILGDLMLKGSVELAEVSTLSDPKLKLVYVITNPDATGGQEILVTTRKRAGERGFLPAAFTSASGNK